MSTKLGQNFLINEEIAEKIALSAGLPAAGNVLEIGPGRGILTKYLSQEAGRVLAVEIDKNLANSLRGKYKNATIIEENILKINLPDLIKENDFESYKVVANLPYYITSKIIRLLLETKYPPQEMILMVQKEVGERIVASDGKESLLSISVKFYARPELVFDVSRENFEPAPEVDSAVLRITKKNAAPDVNTKHFFSLVRAGFSSKRKTLANNLSSAFQIPKAEAAELIEKAHLERDVRAEKLKVEDWMKIYQLWPSFIADQKRK